jgi:hypothetical protein
MPETIVFDSAMFFSGKRSQSKACQGLSGLGLFLRPLLGLPVPAGRSCRRGLLRAPRKKDPCGWVGKVDGIRCRARRDRPLPNLDLSNARVSIFLKSIHGVVDVCHDVLCGHHEDPSDFFDIRVVGSKLRDDF